MDRDPKANPAAHQPSKAEMGEVIVIDGAPDEIVFAVLSGGAARKEPAETKATETK